MRDVQEMTVSNVGLRMIVDITTRGCRWRTCRLPQLREDLSGILDEDTIESVGDSGAGRQQNQAEIDDSAHDMEKCSFCLQNYMEKCSFA